jgi:hypothetical protein
MYFVVSHITDMKLQWTCNGVKLITTQGVTKKVIYTVIIYIYYKLNYYVFIYIAMHLSRSSFMNQAHLSWDLYIYIYFLR